MLNDSACLEIDLNVPSLSYYYVLWLFILQLYFFFSCLSPHFVSCASDSGIGLESGVFVTALVQGSPAAREGSLTVGDRLIAVSLC